MLVLYAFLGLLALFLVGLDLHMYLLLTRGEYYVEFAVLDPQDADCVARARSWAEEKRRERELPLLEAEAVEGRLPVLKWRGAAEVWEYLEGLRGEAQKHCAYVAGGGYRYGWLPAAGDERPLRRMP